MDFTTQIVPIFQNSCVQCHGNGKSKGDFSIDTRKSLLKGGESGPALVVGNSGESLLIKLVSGKDPDRVMPAKGPRLTARQIDMLRAWIDQGAQWTEGFSFAQTKQAHLEPRRPEIPPAEPGSNLSNPIDLILQPYFAEHDFAPGAGVDDRVFARRVYLDLIGLLPPPAEVEQFVADTRPDKRAQLVKRLLNEDHKYAVHWLAFWNDALRNDYQGTGYIDGGREPITVWLYNALASNRPFDQFVRELVTGASGAQGFTKGIVWRGVVNAAQTPQMQAAQNISQVFMGVNLKCASCHDSFINQWKLDDSYGFAAIYSDAALTIERCSQPLDRTATMRFIYPQLGEVDAALPREQRLNQLADIMTSQDNGRLTRTMVNRLWQRLMGRGLVEPADEMDNEPWNADLLDWLACDLADNGHDLRKLIERIVTSRAYQLPSVPAAAESKVDYVFRGPGVRRMTAEQFVDAVSTLTGVWPREGAVASDLPGVAPPKPGLHAPHPATVPSAALAPVRSSLCFANPLTVALGRPNREQVVTDRADDATTLQALELTNGATLAETLRRGAETYAGQYTDADSLISTIYAKSVGREATVAESELAREVIGTNVNADGVEDLLWIVTMLPEFQLIR